MKILFSIILHMLVPLLLFSQGNIKMLVNPAGDTIVLQLANGHYPIDMTGRRLIYSEKGILLSECDVFYGKLNGVSQYFDSNGNIGSRGSFKDGLKTNLWTYFYKNGQIEAIGNYDILRTGKWKMFWNDGKLKATGSYLEGLENGAWVYYHKNGAIKAKGKFKKGLKTDFWELFFSDGKIKSRGNYVDDEKEGVWSYYFETGELKANGAYKNGLKTGEWEYFFEDGFTKLSGSYRKGLKHGRWEQGTPHYPDFTNILIYRRGKWIK